MAENRFNLVDEPWMPMAGYGRASLRDVFARREITAPGGTALEKIAIFKLLQAVAQAACTPENDAAWESLGQEGMANACLEYLARWHDAFWLYGERPFLQFPSVARAKLLPYGALMPHVASGNTSVLFQSQAEPRLDDAARAMLLLVSMSCCFSGKKVDKSVALSPGVEKGASAKAGPALCSQGLLHSFFMGNSVRESVWFNLLTREDIATETTFTEGIGTAPWERMPEGEVDGTAEKLRHSLMGRLVPLARFYLLDEDGVHSVEGIQHPDYLRGGIIDPSVAADFSASRPRMIWADPAKRPWRLLTALLSFLKHHETSKFVCPQLKWGAARLRRPGMGTFRLWSGGIRLSSNAGEQYLTGADDVVESEVTLCADYLDSDHSEWFDALQGAMEKVESMGKAVYSSVFSYYKEEKTDAADRYAARAAQEFWQRAEGYFPELSQACATPENGALENVLKRLALCARESYAHACPQDTARQIQLWVRHRPLISGICGKHKG